MKKKIKDKNFVKIFGIKINSDVLVATIIFMVFLIFYGIKTMYTKHILENEKTVIVSAKIIDVRTRLRGGLGAKSKIGYIKFRYFVNGKEFTRSSESFHIRDNIGQYQVGDCIELRVSLENENVYEWNKSKGTFKCK